MIRNMLSHITINCSFTAQQSTKSKWKEVTADKVVTLRHLYNAPEVHMNIPTAKDLKKHHTYQRISTEHVSFTLQDPSDHFVDRELGSPYKLWAALRDIPQTASFSFQKNWPTIALNNNGVSGITVETGNYTQEKILFCYFLVYFDTPILSERKGISENKSWLVVVSLDPKSNF